MVQFVRLPPLDVLIPLLVILLAPRDIAVPAAAVAVTVALAISGAISAHLGQAPKLQSMARMVAGGIIAMAITYGMGFLVGTPL